MEMKVDLRQNGLAMLFKEYEEIMLKYIWSGVEPTGSGGLFLMVNSKLPEGKTMSRASVIFAATRFVDAGIWDYSTATGKGGHHKRYFAIRSREELWRSITETFIQKVIDGSGLKPYTLMSAGGKRASWIFRKK